MTIPEEWRDPKTVIAAGSLFVGIVGFLFGVLSSKWNRRESRLDSLSKILEPMIRTAQALMLANNARRKCEQLKASFPDPKAAPEAVTRINGFIEEYGKLVSSAAEEFRRAEAEFAARSFRFPDRVSRTVSKAIKTLAEFSRLVDAGFFEKADFKLANFRDDYSQITRIGRGWRLFDPFEGIRKNRRKPKEKKEKNEFELSRDEMESIMELIHKRATTQANARFAVHPPKKLLDDPSIAQSERVIDELKDCVFVIVFQDGTTKMMSLPELMVFTYNLLVIRWQQEEVFKMLQASGTESETTVNVSFQFAMHEIMRPEMVKALLSKIEFSSEACDA